LAIMALDILSIPPMSDEPERLFSSSAHTLGKRRAVLKPSTLEHIESMKSWSK
ncbi:hypothetical protein BJ508DRAFT_186916, partial [Ascobolus immersus RN42]